jgi:hypothetical protein
MQASDSSAAGVNVRDFGAVGDGITDDAAAIQRAIDDTTGGIFFPHGDYLLKKGLRVSLGERGRTYVSSGGARLLNASTEPALHIIGTHEGTAEPKTVTEHTFAYETMPLVSGIEIIGQGDCGDGIVLERTYKPVISSVMIRDCRNGIRLAVRNRDVIIGQCHIIHNRQVGILYDNVSLHQSNIIGCHSSYNGYAGIKVDNGDVRNIQITGNDIEYNNRDEMAPVCADVWFDASAGTGTGIREGAICSNTIQATPTAGGANIRLSGLNNDQGDQIGLLSISGNHISSQEYNVLADYARAIAIGANTFVKGATRNICLRNCRSVNVCGNVIDAIPVYGKGGAGCGGIELREALGCLVANTTIAGASPQDNAAVIALEDCRNCRVNDCILGAGQGVSVNGGQANSVGEIVRA